MKNLISSLLLALTLIACNEHGSKQLSSTFQNKDTAQVKNISSVTACILSELAYCNEPQKIIEQYLPGWKVVWDPLPVGGNYAFVATDGNVYAIGIRGSLIQFSWDAFDNWIYNDLNIAYQKDWPYTNNVSGARISQGAYAGWENLNRMADRKTRKSLWAFLQANIGDKKPLTITGHSLGGNLATVYASYLWKRFKDNGHQKDNIDVITFAAPAAGNGSFADDFNSKFSNSLRIENINDIVPKFPVSGKVSDLGSLYTSTPSAADIMVGYKNASVKLSNVFITMSAGLDLLRITNGISPYVQTNGLGDLITIKLSGKNVKNEIIDWFAEAAYQHSMECYAQQMGAPVIKCDQ
jgi:hypothetical protein